MMKERRHSQDEQDEMLEDSIRDILDSDYD